MTPDVAFGLAIVAVVGPWVLREWLADRKSKR